MDKKLKIGIALVILALVLFQLIGFAITFYFLITSISVDPASEKDQELVTFLKANSMFYTKNIKQFNISSSSWAACQGSFVMTCILLFVTLVSYLLRSKCAEFQSCGGVVFNNIVVGFITVQIIGMIVISSILFRAKRFKDAYIMDISNLELTISQAGCGLIIVSYLYFLFLLIKSRREGIGAFVPQVNNDGSFLPSSGFFDKKASQDIVNKYKLDILDVPVTKRWAELNADQINGINEKIKAFNTKNKVSFPPLPSRGAYINNKAFEKYNKAISRVVDDPEFQFMIDESQEKIKKNFYTEIRQLTVANNPLYNRVSNEMNDEIFLTLLWFKCSKNERTMYIKKLFKKYSYDVYITTKNTFSSNERVLNYELFDFNLSEVLKTVPNTGVLNDAFYRSIDDKYAEFKSGKKSYADVYRSLMNDYLALSKKFEKHSKEQLQHPEDYKDSNEDFADRVAEIDNAVGRMKSQQTFNITKTSYEAEKEIYDVLNNVEKETSNLVEKNKKEGDKAAKRNEYYREKFYEINKKMDDISNGYDVLIARGNAQLKYEEDDENKTIDETVIQKINQMVGVMMRKNETLMNNVRHLTAEMEGETVNSNAPRSDKKAIVKDFNTLYELNNNEYQLYKSGLNDLIKELNKSKQKDNPWGFGQMLEDIPKKPYFGRKRPASIKRIQI